MSELFEQVKRLVLSMNAASDYLPEETRQRCAEMLKKIEPLLVLDAISERCKEILKEREKK